jgi:hypothetical protein
MVPVDGDLECMRDGVIEGVPSLIEREGAPSRIVVQVQLSPPKLFLKL